MDLEVGFTSKSLEVRFFDMLSGGPKRTLFDALSKFQAKPTSKFKPSPSSCSELANTHITDKTRHLKSITVKVEKNSDHSYLPPLQCKRALSFELGLDSLEVGLDLDLEVRYIFQHLRHQG